MYKVGLYTDMYRLLRRDATQSVVMRLHVVCPSVLIFTQV